MPDSTPVQAAALPWYQSGVQKAQIAALVSALVALSPHVGKMLGIDTPTQATEWVETIFGFITLAAPIVGTVMRARSQIQPLTLTKAKAEVHPATLAAAAASSVTTGDANVSTSAAPAPAASPPQP